MGISQEKEQMIFTELPNKLQDAISKACQEVSEEEQSEINGIFLKTKTRIEDILVYDHKYSEAQAENMVDELLSECKRKVKQKANDIRQTTIQNGGHIITDMSKKEIVRAEENDEIDEKKSALNRAYGNVIGYSEDIITDENLEAAKKYNYTVEDLIMTELKSELKRRIDPYSSERAEEAFSEVSRILSRNLLGDLEQCFDENSRALKRNISSKIDECLHEFSIEYENLTKKEEQEKSEKNVNNEQNKEEDKKLDFSDLLATEDELAEMDSKRMGDKNKTEDLSFYDVLPTENELEEMAARRNKRDKNLNDENLDDKFI